MPDQNANARHETTTLIVSVDQTLDEDAQIAQINKQVGEGWKVIQKVAISGGDMGPGGGSEDFLRMQVTLQREVGADGTINEDFDPVKHGDQAGSGGDQD
jgi:hypothetical protein